MYKSRWQKDVDKQLDELKSATLNPTFPAQLQEAKDVLGQMQQLGEYLREKLEEANTALDRYELAIEKIQTNVAVVNDAQAARYLELKKRLDKYDTTFQQLGILIKAIPIAP